MSDSLSVDEKNEIMENRKLLLKKCRQYIDAEFNPSKKKFYGKSRDDYEILEFLVTSKFDYEQALSVSDDQNFQIHFIRPPNTCFVSNYFCDGLNAWEANMDIQPVFNHY